MALAILNHSALTVSASSLSAAHLGQHAASRSALLTYLLCGEAEIKCTMVAEPVLGNVARKFTQYVMKSLNNPPVLSYICRD